MQIELAELAIRIALVKNQNIGIVLCVITFLADTQKLKGVKMKHKYMIFFYETDEQKPFIKIFERVKDAKLIAKKTNRRIFVQKLW